MINTNELMRGNKAIIGKGRDWEEVVVVDEVFDGVVGLQGREFTTYASVLEPIPITEELLLKNGFIKNDYLREIVDIKEYEKQIDKCLVSFRDTSNTIGRDWYIHIDNRDCCSVGGCDVQYVNQAQNICTILGVKLDFKL